MFRYLLRKTLGWIAMIVVATNLTYFLANAFLDPRANYFLMRPPRSPEQIARALQQYNLDPGSPILQRWWTWISGVVTRWDWGFSPIGERVNDEIAFRIGISAQLIVCSLILSVVVGVGLGVYTAARQYKRGDRFHEALSIITLNTPMPVAALVVVLVAISINQGLGDTYLFVAGASSPTVSGFFPTLVDRIGHLILPTIALLIINYAAYHLLQRSLLLDTINADFVRTARAKGLTKQQAIRGHALRTSLIPVATSVAFAIPALFTGAVLTETIFAWQGMGQYFIQTISKNDVSGAVAIAAFAALMTAIGAILADVATVVLDPRVRVN